MKLTTVTIAGFRGYRDEISIKIDEETTTVIGRNDAGKSSLFEALDIYFGGAKLELTDFTVDSTNPVAISCTFIDLPPSVVIDVDRSTTLKDEYLVRADGSLTITKTWTRSKLTAPAITALAAHPDFGDGTDLLNAKLPALKALAKTMKITDESIGDKRTSSAYRQAIWETSLTNGSAKLVELAVPLTVEDGKSVGTAIASYMPQFHLFRADRPGTEADQLAQDPAKAAIKAVLDEHEDQLERLSQIVQAEISTLLNDVVDRLSEVAPNLASSLNPTDPKPVWNKAFSGLQFIDENGVPLSKRGSGTRRLVLLSFFRATAEKGIGTAIEATNQYRRGVITAVEEPETALHADLQTDIISALQDIGELPHRQVLLTTHSSNLIRMVPARSIRYITGEKFSRRCISITENDDARELLAELNKSLGVFTDHNVRCFILVEGRNDVTGLKFLTAALSEATAGEIQAFSDLEEKGLISFMPIGGGGNASLWESNLSPFRRDEVHIMDSDRTSSNHPLKKEMTTLQNRADDQRHVYVLDRRELENYLTEDAILDVYSHNSDFRELFLTLRDARGDWDYQDVPSLCAEAIHTLTSPTETPWEDLAKESQKQKGSKAKKTLAKAFAHSSVANSLIIEESDLYRAVRKISTLSQRTR